MPILYEPPGDVGADRILNGVGAYARFGGPVVVVDFGTATTFDVVSKDGAYIGGVIAPIFFSFSVASASSSAS